MSNTRSVHFKLCIEAAKFLQTNEWCKYVAVELITVGSEHTDVWGTTGYTSHMIEVKTSRADFLKDQKKPCRFKKGLGNFRWYLVPEGKVKEEEIPENWGLLFHDGEKITRYVKHPVFTEDVSNQGENAILCSIMRREGIKKRIFNYRNPQQQ